METTIETLDALVALRSLGREALRRRLGTFGLPSLTLRSRAGKTSRRLVYPERGLALSASGSDGSAEFMELSPPRGSDAYCREIYEAPGPFIR